MAKTKRSVLAERQRLIWLRTKRVSQEPLAAALAEIKAKRAGAIVEESSQILLLHPFKQVVHVFEVIVTRSDVICVTAFVGFPFNRREH
jgi:hypothetical protein